MFPINPPQSHLSLESFLHSIFPSALPQTAQRANIFGGDGSPFCPRGCAAGGLASLVHLVPHLYRYMDRYNYPR